MISYAYAGSHMRFCIHQQPDILICGQIIIQIAYNELNVLFPSDFFQNENSKFNNAQLCFTMRRNSQTTSFVTHIFSQN